MGLFSGAKAQITGQKAMRTHVSANQLANEGKPGEAQARYELALKQYEQAIGEGLNAPNVLLGYSVLLMRLGQFDRARDVMQNMRTLKNMTDETWFELRFNYAIYRWKTEDLDGAIETILRASKHKENAAYYTTLGMFLVDKAKLTGDFEALETLNRKAMEYDEEDPGVLDNMGGMYEAKMERAFASGDASVAQAYREKAKEYYQKAHGRKQNQITTIYSLARLCHEDGEDDRARELLSRADSLYYSALCPVTKEMMEALKQAVH